MTPRLLVANGCSFTWGDELADRSAAWPHVLGRELGVEVLNLGVAGGSNRRMVRSTVATLPGLVAARDLRPAEVIVLAMWTSVERYECHDADPDPGGRSPVVAGDDQWHRILPWAATRRDRISVNYYRHLYSDTGAAATFLLDWLLLEAYLARCGYRFGFLASMPVLGDLRVPQELAEQLDRARILGGGVREMDAQAMTAHTRDHFPYGPRQHPLAAAHEAYARTVVAPWVAALPAGG